MDPSKVRYLTFSHSTQFYWGRVEDLPIDEVSLKLGLERPTRPVRITVVKGGKAGDFLWNGLQLVVGSEKVLRVFQEGGFKGYATFPVEAYVKDQRLGGYSGIAVTGRAGPLDQEKSHARRFHSASGSTRGFSAMEGLFFDPRRWDGSDIFCVEEVPGRMLMVERVWKALEAARVSAYRALPLTEFRFGVPLAREAKRRIDLGGPILQGLL